MADENRSLLQMAMDALALLDRPANAVRSGLVHGADHILPGLQGQVQTDATELPFVRDLPDQGLELGPLNLTPRTVAGFGANAVIDPLSLVPAGKGAQLAGKGLAAGERAFRPFGMGMATAGLPIPIRGSMSAYGRSTPAPLTSRAVLSTEKEGLRGGYDGTLTPGRSTDTKPVPGTAEPMEPTTGPQIPPSSAPSPAGGVYDTKLRVSKALAPVPHLREQVFDKAPMPGQATDEAVDAIAGGEISAVQNENLRQPVQPLGGTDEERTAAYKWANQHGKDVQEAGFGPKTETTEASVFDEVEAELDALGDEIVTAAPGEASFLRERFDHLRSLLQQAMSAVGQRNPDWEARQVSRAKGAIGAAEESVAQDKIWRTVEGTGDLTSPLIREEADPNSVAARLGLDEGQPRWQQTRSPAEKRAFQDWMWGGGGSRDPKTGKLPPQGKIGSSWTGKDGKDKPALINELRSGKVELDGQPRDLFLPGGEINPAHREWLEEAALQRYSTLFRKPGAGTGNVVQQQLDKMSVTAAEGQGRRMTDPSRSMTGLRASGEAREAAAEDALPDVIRDEMGSTKAEAGLAEDLERSRRNQIRRTKRGSPERAAAETDIYTRQIDLRDSNRLDGAELEQTPDRGNSEITMGDGEQMTVPDTTLGGFSQAPAFQKRAETTEVKGKTVLKAPARDSGVTIKNDELPTPRSMAEVAESADDLRGHAQETGEGDLPTRMADEIANRLRQKPQSDELAKKLISELASHGWSKEAIKARLISIDKSLEPGRFQKYMLKRVKSGNNLASK